MHFPESASRPGRSLAYHVAVTVLLASLSGVAYADALSFQDALALALRETPALRANTAQVDAAAQAAIPAGELPDPKLGLGVDNLPIDGPDRYSLSRDFMTMRRIGVSQEFPNRAKRKARVAAAQGRVTVAEAQTRITRLTVLREVAVAWIGRHSIERQLTRSDALLAENRLFEAAVRAQVVAGKALASEVVAPRQEAALIEERQDVLRAQRQQALAQLRRWIGPAADAPLTGVVPDWPTERDVLLHRLRQHPELTAFDSKDRVLDAEVAEARAAKRPDWALELAYQQRGPQFGDMVSLQVRFDLPLFAGSRQEPQIAAKLAERSALLAEREAMLREHAAALEADFAEYQRLVNAVQRQRQVLLPLAEERVTLALAAWRGGKGSLTELIAARRERIDAELKAIALEGERQQMAARLHYAYGDIAGEL